MAEKMRLDQLLLEKGLAESRQKAKALIMEGVVLLNKERADKAGAMVSPEAEITIKKPLRYVSRGGLKLEKALQNYPISLKDKICLDIGASTGGFTDCMLQNGAAKVYAVDVGYGQLAWKLRQDPRVIQHERTNARYLTKEMIPEPIDFFSVDVSFISLTKILPVALPFLKEDGSAVILIKPQFEAGRDQVGKKGVVRDPKVHRSVVESMYDFCKLQNCSVAGIDYSPIQGPQGNIEYLFWLNKKENGVITPREAIEEVINRSHEAFEKQVTK